MEPGFHSLKVIHGQELHTAVGIGDGFAMYIVENPSLVSLGGLQNLSSIEGLNVIDTSVDDATVGEAPASAARVAVADDAEGLSTEKGAGRVYIVQNEKLCYAHKLDCTYLYSTYLPTLSSMYPSKEYFLWHLPLLRVSFMPVKPGCEP